MVRDEDYWLAFDAAASKAREEAEAEATEAATETVSPEAVPAASAVDPEESLVPPCDVDADTMARAFDQLKPLANAALRKALEKWRAGQEAGDQGREDTEG